MILYFHSPVGPYILARALAGLFQSDSPLYTNEVSAVIRRIRIHRNWTLIWEIQNKGIFRLACNEVLPEHLKNAYADVLKHSGLADQILLQRTANLSGGDAT